MTKLRVDDTYSDRYALMEDTLIKIGKGEGNGQLSEVIYKMDPMMKNLTQNFLYAREMELLMGKNTMDKDGKSTLISKSTGRPIEGGDGLIPQVERFASKYAANIITINTFHTIMSMMTEKAENPEGNTYMFICNELMWAIIQRVLSDYLAHHRTDGAYLWSKTGKYVKVGTTYNSYEWGKRNFCPNAVRAAA